VDFKNTVVIMTSNVATEELRRAASIGFITPHFGETDDESDNRERHTKAMEGLRRAFRPEFLNRIDQIVVFHSLGQSELHQIIDLLMAKVRARLEEQNLGLRYGEDLDTFLMKEGFDQEFGARPLRRAIQTHVDDALADAILNGTLQPGQTAVLQVVDDTVQVSAEGQPRLLAEPAPAAQEVA